jgi:hypothetical protein
MPTSVSDLVLLRRAINEDWAVPAIVRAAIISELENEIQSTDRRRVLSVARTFLAMESADSARRLGPHNWLVSLNPWHAGGITRRFGDRWRDGR